MEVMDTNKWTQFSLLESSFLTKLKTVCVFGSLGHEALMVTHEDEVFALGTNGAGCLGVGDLHSTMIPKKVEALSGKKVKSFACGSGPHVLALTFDGDVYVWGHNGYCELGNGTTKQSLVPTLVVLPSPNVFIVDVACGAHFSLTLSKDGEVYAWGQNNCGQVGSGTLSNQIGPRKVGGLLNPKKVISIAAGQAWSMAVTDNGELYSWGYNASGQLGLGNNTNQQHPVLVPGCGHVVFTKVVCGYAHTLALTDLGQVYAWGANNYGQLGSDNKSNLMVPTLLTHVDRMIDIAAAPLCNTSAAMTQNSRTYMWGQCKGQCIVTPLETPFTSMHDVFACFSTPFVTHKPIELAEEETVTVSLKMAFDDSNTSDLIIKVRDKQIHVHKAVLKIRSQYFRAMFQDHWQEGNQSDLSIEQYTHEVYRAFLEYLYTDTVNILPENALELLDLANAYCESRLKKKCEQIIKRGITVDNAAMLYSKAIHYQAKELEEFCFRFSLNHMTKLTQTEGFNSLEESIVKDFIRKAAVEGVFKS